MKNVYLGNKPIIKMPKETINIINGTYTMPDVKAELKGKALSITELEEKYNPANPQTNTVTPETKATTA